jgi:hypothetical protein
VGVPLQKPPFSALYLPILAPEFTESGQEEAGKGLKILFCGGSSLHATPFRQEAAVNWMPIGTAVPCPTQGASHLCWHGRCGGYPLRNSPFFGLFPALLGLRANTFHQEKARKRLGQRISWRSPSPALQGRLGGGALSKPSRSQESFCMINHACTPQGTCTICQQSFRAASHPCWQGSAEDTPSAKLFFQLRIHPWRPIA